LPLGQKWLGERSLETERQDVLVYLQQEADRSDTIYAWDSRANWYQEAGKWSASALLSPVYYQQLAENQLRLANDLESVRPRYIVVNTNLALLEDVDKELTTTYTEVKTDLQTLKLYERK
ncbi:heme transporter CcmD, partial [Streptococcus danieliae]|nr:heme transporter CcmD [Streptococcus danieliae]